MPARSTSGGRQRSRQCPRCARKARDLAKPGFHVRATAYLLGGADAELGYASARDVVARSAFSIEASFLAAAGSRFRWGTTARQPSSSADTTAHANDRKPDSFIAYVIIQARSHPLTRRFLNSPLLSVTGHVGILV